MVQTASPLFVLMCFVLSFGVGAASKDGLSHIRVCGDAIDWSPYTYLQDDEVRGYDVEVLNQALTNRGINYDFKLTSWSRCLKGTQKGDYDLAVSATYNSKRDASYLYTEWYYTLTPHYVYSSNKFPNGLTINNVQDLKQYRLCGIHGYSYGDFKLDKIDRSGHSNHDILEKLRGGSCDVYLSWGEILAGVKTHWEVEHKSTIIISQAVPKMEPHKFYMLISRQFSQQETLKKLLDETIRLVRSESNSLK